MLSTFWCLWNRFIWLLYIDINALRGVSKIWKMRWRTLKIIFLNWRLTLKNSLKHQVICSIYAWWMTEPYPYRIGRTAGLKARMSSFGQLPIIRMKTTLMQSILWNSGYQVPLCSWWTKPVLKHSKLAKYYYQSYSSSWKLTKFFFKKTVLNKILWNQGTKKGKPKVQ